MTENTTVIPLPIVARVTASGSYTEVILPSVRLPRRVYGRLTRIGAQWSMTPTQAAESLLIDAINNIVGVRKR